MSPELIAIIAAAIALAAVILPGQHAMRRDVADLRERMGRLEGLFDGFTHHDTPIRIGRGMVRGPGLIEGKKQASRTLFGCAYRTALR